MGTPTGVVEMHSARNCRPCKGAARGGRPLVSPLLRHCKIHKYYNHFIYKLIHELYGKTSPGGAVAKYSPIGFEVLGSHLGTSSNSEWVYDILSPHICHQWHSRFCKKKTHKKKTLYQNLGEPPPSTRHDAIS